MNFAEAVASFETQLHANQRPRHTLRSYLRDLGMLRAWLEREGQPPAIQRITPDLLCRFLGAAGATLIPGSLMA